ncbi:NADH pyrophosphatase [Tilletia horrida]|nr:NADH pyrophosphatase [Tilletia horrida]
MPGPQPPYRSGHTVNFYAGSKLNRFSWLRTSSDFINGAVTSPSARFIILNKLNPLIHKESEGTSEAGKLATLGWTDVRDTVLDSIRLARGDGQAPAGGDKVFGPDVFGLNGPLKVQDVDADAAAEKQFGKATESIGSPNLVLVFLGVDESDTQASPSVPGQVATGAGRVDGDDEGHGKQLDGVPYFALSVSYQPQRAGAAAVGSEEKEEVLPTHRFREELLASGKYEFVDTRSLAQAASWPADHAAMLAQARTLVDWNERMASVLASTNPASEFLKPFLSSNSANSSSVKTFEEDGKVWPCPATLSLSNFSYPRQDSVVIMGVLNRTGDKILLGRQRTWPKKMYSCLAGFLEAGESLEEAVKREGCFAICKSDNPESEIRLDLDNELEDARFFSREEVLEVIETSAKRIMTKKDLARYEEGQNRNVLGQAKKPSSAPQVDEKGQWKQTDQSGAEAGSDEEGEKKKPKWDKKDEGSVANVRAGGPAASQSFGIPASTAIAHVLISSWARGEAYIPSLNQTSKM